MTMPAVAALNAPHLHVLKQLAASRWLWCLAVVMIPIIRIALTGQHGLDVTLGDTDDATRILQVKALLGGAGWYDTTITKIGGATPLVSHWSRLIDAPLALLVVMFGLFTTADTALLLARIVWPSLLLLVFLRLLVAEAEVRRGWLAGLICAGFAMTCLTGLFQFRIGRIDHHNAMILGALIGLLMLARSLEAPRTAAIAGSLLGLALAVGYEPLALIVPLLALASLAAVIDTRFIDAVAAAMKALAVTLLAVVLLTVAPARWLSGVCDALSINMVLLMGTGAAGLHLIARHRASLTLTQRVGALVATGAVAAVAFLLPEPACIAGPFGQVSAEAKQLWLVHVRETQSILVEAKGNPLIAMSFVLLMTAGIWAAVSRWRAEKSIESAATAIVLFSAMPAALLQLKFLPYASWLAIFVIALRVAAFQGRGEITPRLARLAGAITLNQWTFAVMCAVALTAAGIPLDDDDGSDACYKTANIEPLAKLPAGLVASSANMGPYIAALTPHSVIAAPYHRIDDQIVLATRMFESPLKVSSSLLARSGARYLIHCAKEPRAAKAKPGDGTLNGALLSAETPAFLREIPNASPLRDLRMFEIVSATR